MIRALAALLSILLLWPANAVAQDGIHRCVSADGHPLFTDQPCAALQATPVNQNRDAVATQTPSTTTLTTPQTPPPVLCASSVSELRQSVIDAFASRDPNRLAGLMLWGGYGREAVVANIRSMNALMQQPLLGIGQGDDASPPPDPHTISDIDNLDQSLDSQQPAIPPPAAPVADRQIVVRTAASDGSGVPHETRFSVVQRSGCLWLRNSG